MAGNVLTDIQIFNKALLRLGETKGVTAVDGSDTSKYGSFAGVEYYETRDEELRSHDWSFATKRAQLVQALCNAVASWLLAGTTLTVTGITVNTLTVTTVSGSRILTAASVQPDSSWVGLAISGTGIPTRAIIQAVDMVTKYITISLPATASATGVTVKTSPIHVGWLVASGWVPGNCTPSYPSGIPTGTSVIAVAGATITISAAATLAGTSVPVAFMPVNSVGYWYMYNCPPDSLRVKGVYQLLPSFVYMWPFKIVHANQFPSKKEGDYLYTDLDPNNGNVYVEYIAQVTDPYLFDPLFTDALALRLASKLAMYVTQGLQVKANFEGDYLALITRAKMENLIEKDDDLPEDTWWSDRESP